ncbi:phosphoribosylformylglycinamidine synthase subunit PurL [bacterium]|nr:phosphoribosylformylglycinamidine synthase subunit PurL [bacterium]
MHPHPLDTTKFPDNAALAAQLRARRLGLAPDEARKIQQMLGHPPTQAELCVFDIEWSEHCSYKSSRPILKKYLPTESRNVILGPGEDSGIVYFTTHEGVRYGIVISHESHNHPSQVLPVEGAATGIGGIVRDVDCMGASVIGTLDPLRFGDPFGVHRERTLGIVKGVVTGIWQYGNALGVPNLGGDVAFDKSFDDNCLVNVVALGICREDEIIHSRVPPGGEGYALILVGKATDWSGFGGAVFASDTLDEKNEEVNKGAVQIPDPFLKNVLLLNKANQEVRRRAKELGLQVGMKDLGAGGIACATSEIGAAGNFGVELNLDAVHVAEENLPPEVILCAETQERYVWAVPPSFVEEVLDIYNNRWDLPNINPGARAGVIGYATREPRFRVRHKGKLVVDADIHDVTGGIVYHRESRPRPVEEKPLELPEETALPTFDKGGWGGFCGAALARMLSSPDLCSREYLFSHYDHEVQGNTIIRPGEADAGVIAPLPGCLAGVAVACDGNPFYGALHPYWGGANAVAEAIRNVAAVGARPVALTDCLNFGNPEVPTAFWEFCESVRGISDAARNLKDDAGEPIPIISGNVSFYNQSESGQSISPSPIVAVIGVLSDYSRALTMELKQPGSRLLLIGRRYNELGGSAYARIIHNVRAGKVPEVRWEEERKNAWAVIQLAEMGRLLSAHDISEGGLLVALAEMLMACPPDNPLGAHLICSCAAPEPVEGCASPPSPTGRGQGEGDRPDLFLFSESSGFLVEVHPGQVNLVKRLLSDDDIAFWDLGETNSGGRLRVESQGGETLVDAPVAQLRELWKHGWERMLEAQ